MTLLLEKHPKTQNKSERDKLPTDLPSTLVTSGTQRESRIDLVTLCLESENRTSVFIYPSITYRIGSDNLRDINSSYLSGRIIVSREFKDLSAEELDSLFLRKSKEDGVISAFDYRHKVGKIPVIEHSYHESAYKFLSHVITDIKA